MTVAPGAIGGPMSALTPVSPAAILGDIAEKSKALEDAALLLAHELIENCVWESAWRANASVATAPKKPPVQLWQLDVQYVMQLLSSAGLMQEAPALSTTFSGKPHTRLSLIPSVLILPFHRPSVYVLDSGAGRADTCRRQV